ncbi:MAG: hypothetical protein M0P43_07385 [Arcobacteraceae bacterium]|nr:hypothetical protein [Arcobacteraceae bacterium]MDY0327223.1 hypothetical protein [Arcobacteraceae bacterium]
MSLKENLDYMKTELTAQEKFIENFVKAEKIYKKYKKTIINGAIGVVVIIIAMIGFNYIEEQNKVTANLAFNKFLANNNDAVALEVLKDKNKNLYEIAMYIKDDSYVPEITVFREIALFQKSIKEDDTNGLNNVISSSSFLLKDYAIVFKALLEAKSDNIVSAKETLQMLPQESSVSDLADLLSHYIATKSK